MKKLALIAVGLVTACAMYAQGTLNFANIGGGGLNSPFKDAAGVNLTGQYKVELLAGPSASSLSSIVVLTTTFAAGYFNGSSQSIANLTSTSGFALVRVWSDLTATSWANVSSGFYGVSGGIAAPTPFGITVTAPATPAGTPASMVNMPAISLIPVVPEPSVIALGAVGLAALLLRRRK
jgi:hypothetical protein